MQGDEIVRLGTAANPAEAVAWQEVLQEEGIPFKVLGLELDSSFLDPNSARPEVWVHRNDLERAVAAIEEQRRIAAEDAAMDADPDEG